MQDSAKASQEAMSGFETVKGIDPATIRLKREYEAQVEKKVMNEASHIVWAYGLIWVLFAGYAVYLTRKQRALSSDLANLQGAMQKRA